MISLLMNVFSAFVIKVSHVDFILALEKSLSIFPVMHGIYEHSFKFIDGMIEPKNVSKVVLIYSCKVNFIIEIVCLLNDMKELFRQFVVVF